MPDIITVARMMGGDVTGHDSCLVPGPAHSKADRSLSIKIDPTRPLGVTFNSFATNDSPRDCYDYIAAALGLKPVQVAQVSRQPDAKPKSSAAEYSLRLWSETIDAPDTLAEKYLTSRHLSL